LATCETVDGRIILKWIFKNWGGMDWIAMAQDRAGCCECCDEISGSIKCREFLDYEELLASQIGLSCIELVS
jgi:hypothetical protein